MRKNSSTLAIAVAIALSASAITAHAEQIRVGTGSASGNYSRIAKEIQQYCKNEVNQIEVNTAGSLANLDGLVNNEMNGGFVQTDALFHRSRNEDLSNLKTLISLYPEEVHVIVRAGAGVATGGVMGFNQKTVEFNAVESLAGQTVVAFGGSYITAQVIRLQSEIPYTVAEVPDFAAAKAAVDSGKAAAMVVVGGQRMPDVDKLGKGYRLLPFTEASIGKLKSVYVPARLNYPGMGQSGVQSIATEALYVVQNYKTPKYSAPLLKLRECVHQNLDELKETTGLHPKWKAINKDNAGKWPYYQAN